MSAYYITRKITLLQWIAFDAYYPEIVSYGTTKKKAVFGLPGFQHMTETNIKEIEVRNMQLIEYQIEYRKSWRSIINRMRG